MDASMAAHLSGVVLACLSTSAHGAGALDPIRFTKRQAGVEIRG
jgi:hypothetical protein